MLKRLTQGQKLSGKTQRNEEDPEFVVATREDARQPPRGCRRRRGTPGVCRDVRAIRTDRSRAEKENCGWGFHYPSGRLILRGGDQRVWRWRKHRRSPGQRRAQSAMQPPPMPLWLLMMEQNELSGGKKSLFYKRCWTDYISK